MSFRIYRSARRLYFDLSVYSAVAYVVVVINVSVTNWWSVNPECYNHLIINALIISVIYTHVFVYCLHDYSELLKWLGFSIAAGFKNVRSSS